MIFIVYAETTRLNLEERLGEAEYSYHFVLERFRPMLERLGTVVEVFGDENIRVDAVYDIATALGHECLFLSFTPPHQTPTRLRCPTVCVFAWEFSDLPHGERVSRHDDWGHILGSMGCTITHSEHAAQVTRDCLGEDFPVCVVPAPVWDEYCPKPGQAPTAAWIEPTQISYFGEVFQLNARALADDSGNNSRIRAQASFLIDRDDLVHPSDREASPGIHGSLALRGVTYVSVFNPNDGRKNWQDIVRCFCMALGECEDATLLLKIAHFRQMVGFRQMLNHVLDGVKPLRCRIVLLAAHLDDAEYRKLLASTSYMVNASTGEGQCIPLMEAMSGGRPAIAPAHTGMADYVNDGNAFVVDSSLEPAVFPHLFPRKHRTWQHRTNAHSLFRAYLESYRVAKEDQETYAEMSRNATSALKEHCSTDKCEARFRRFLSEIWPLEQGQKEVDDTRQQIRLQFERDEAKLREEFDAEGRKKNPRPLEFDSGAPLDFVVGGFSKCGTTTLTGLLSDHPDLVIPLEEFWIKSPFVLSDEGRAKIHTAATRGVCNVLFSGSKTEGRIRGIFLEYNPDMKIVLIARDPLDRVESSFCEFHHSWSAFANLEPPPLDVGKAIDEVPDLALVPNCMYGARLAEITRETSPWQVHVLLLEDLERDPAGTMADCYDFLGVAPESVAQSAPPKLNPRARKYHDTPLLRQLLSKDTGDELASVTRPAIRNLPLIVTDQLFVPLGLRVPFSDELPGWNHEAQRSFVASIKDDTRSFLKALGRDESVWPRFARLAQEDDAQSELEARGH